MIYERPRVHTVVLALVGLTLALSIVAALDGRAGGSLYWLLALWPVRVWSGELWRLVTWALVYVDPWALVFGCVTLYWLGGDLADHWGPRRFTRYVALVLVGVGVGTAGLALVLGGARHAYLGGWALGDALVIAWGLQFPARRVRLYGVLEVSGVTFAYATLAFVGLLVVFLGLVATLPEVVASMLALAWMGGIPRRLGAGLRRGVSRPRRAPASVHDLHPHDGPDAPN